MNKVSTKEFAWYAVAGTIALLGIIAMVFGIIGYHMGGVSGGNFIAEFESHIGLSLRVWGIIIMAVGVIMGISVLLVYAKKADRENEKRIRREQRLAAQTNSDIEVKNAVEVVTVEATPEAK